MGSYLEQGDVACLFFCRAVNIVYFIDHLHCALVPVYLLPFRDETALCGLKPLFSECTPRKQIRNEREHDARDLVACNFSIDRSHLGRTKSEVQDRARDVFVLLPGARCRVSRNPNSEAMNSKIVTRGEEGKRAAEVS